MMQTLPSHPPLSCKNERKLCNQVSGVLLTYLLLMNLTVIAAMLVEAGLRLIHLGTLGYGLNAALHRVMQPDSLSCSKAAPVTWWSPAYASCSSSCGRGAPSTGTSSAPAGPCPALSFGSFCLYSWPFRFSPPCSPPW